MPVDTRTDLPKLAAGGGEGHRRDACGSLGMAANLQTSVGASAILEKKQLLEEDLRRVEKQIYDLEGEYLQVRTSRAERRGAGADASRWLTL